MDNRVTEAIRLARELQPRYNIFTQIEELPPAGGAGSGTLEGVPIAVKDLIDHKGRVTTGGSAFYRETAEVTAPAILRLEENGATVIGRTGLHEFAFGFSSENPHFGPVRNPWDPATSPGGSSGGSGAAVAAGIVAIAVGTDTGGSVRVPAALCGCYGLKVTHGAIPLEGVFPLVPSIDTVGPLANSIANLASSYRTMSGDQRTGGELAGIRLGIPQPWFDEAPMSDSVAAAFARATNNLIDLGHEVHEIRMPEVVPARPLGYAIAAEVVPVHTGFRSRGLPYGEEVAARLDESEAVTPEQIEQGARWQKMIRTRFSDALATVDFLITPTVPAMVKTIGVEEIDGVHYRKVLSWFSAIVNHALVPALAMPLIGTGAPPVSLQVIGPAGSEPALLEFGASLEESGVVGFTPATPG
jgi:aspartyl-tRNA(Asn)/glutamyl-tRNA(Gln) amidotransferase subunit A